MGQARRNLPPNTAARKRVPRQDRMLGPRIEAGGGDRESFLQALVGGDSIERQVFRQLFDEWCDTGLIAQREERPHTRNIWRTEDAIRLCDQFWRDHPPSFKLGNGGHRYYRPVASNEDMIGALVSGDGNPEASRQCGIMDFIDFLDKQYCFQFAKCRECGRYFDMGRKPKEIYPHGIHCPRPQCQRTQASKAALAATHKARFIEKLDRLALVARTLANWQEPAVRPDSEAILLKATHLNRREVIRLGLSANWITRHREEIERLARGEHNTSENIEEGAARGALQAR
jgi:hypothetical protein